MLDELCLSKKLISILDKIVHYYFRKGVLIIRFLILT
nr:MAG TPA: hypothetical protein [Caudoviricetes sp.]